MTTPSTPASAPAPSALNLSTTLLAIADSYELLKPEARAALMAVFGGHTGLLETHAAAQLIVQSTPPDALALVLARLLVMASCAELAPDHAIQA